MSESEAVSADLGNGVFDSESVRGLGLAFEAAWAKAEASGLRGAARDSTAVREAIAKRIMESAKSGERDHGRLVEDGLLAVRGATGGGSAANITGVG